MRSAAESWNGPDIGGGLNLYFLRMIFSENRFTLFRIMRQ
jgi:hypothetical protein